MKLVPELTVLFTLLASAGAVSQAEAERRFLAAGISWSSSGNCNIQTNRRCTSFKGLQDNTVASAITLKGACNCDLTITGGTETGHSTSGRKRHDNGYKLDFKKNTALTSYIKNTFTPIGDRGDGYPQWQSNAGNIYCDEGNHWDVLYV